MSTSSTPVSSTGMVSPPRRRSPSPPAFSAKFEHLVSPLPRRPPPTALRLVSGPLPHRARPKHTLPSLPRPAFYPKIHVPRTGPTPRKRAQEPLILEKQVPAIHLARERYPELRVPGYGSENDGDGESEGSGSEEEGSVSSSGSFSRRGSVESIQDSLERGRTMRGPWDHAGSIKVPFNVQTVLPVPRKAAVTALQRV